MKRIREAIRQWWSAPYCPQCGKSMKGDAVSCALGRCWFCRYTEERRDYEMLQSMLDAARAPRRLIPLTPDADGAR